MRVDKDSEGELSAPQKLSEPKAVAQTPERMSFVKKLFSIIGRVLFSGPIPLAAILVIVALSAGGAIFVVKRNPQLLGLSVPKQEAAAVPSEVEVKSLVAKVGQLVLLPEGETPTVATVTDINQVKNQPFFQNAQNGDKVLVYPKAKKAILYRPSIERVIDMAPVNIGTTSATAPLTPTPLAATSPTPLITPAVDAALLKPKVFLLNGTTTVGLTRKYETELKSQVPGAVVVDRDNAKKRDYAKTIIIDLSGNKQDQVTALAKLLEISVSGLPAGEIATDAADFLIIVGADKQ